MESIAKEDCLQAQVNTATHMMSAVVKLEGSWSDGENNFSYSDQLMQNSPTSSQSSTSGDGDLDNIGSPVAAHPAGRRKLKRRRKRMLTGVSRQRRAANERERRRIQGVNRAFLELKNALPVSDTAEISKIDILRVAIRWIEHLSELLDQDERIPSEPTNFCDSVEPKLHELLGEEFYINARELENDDFLQGEGTCSLL